MELLSPIGVSVHLCHNGKEAVLVLANLKIRKLLTGKSLCEDGLYLRVGIFFIVELFDAMI